MARWRCQSCGGTYSDTQRDGTLYFHACPPDHIDERGERVPIPNRRDENIRPGLWIRTGVDGTVTVVDTDGQVVAEGERSLPIKAEGRGRTLIEPEGAS